MKINIKGTNLDLTSTITDYLDKKMISIQKLINHKDTGVICDIEVGRTTRHHRSGDIFRAEINLQTEGKTFYASCEEGDLYAAIDKVKDEIRSKLLSYKNKKKTLFKKGGTQIKNLLKNLKRPEK